MPAQLQQDLESAAGVSTGLAAEGVSVAAGVSVAVGAASALAAGSTTSMAPAGTGSPHWWLGVGDSFLGWDTFGLWPKSLIMTEQVLTELTNGSYHKF